MTRRLHIGGKVRAEGWEVLNAMAAPYVDHVCNAKDLSQFAAGSFGEIYASHILEHLDYAGEIESTLREWHRVLVPGGRLYVSVPDLDVLAELFLRKEGISFEERFFIMRMIFGGHMNEYDYHVVGLNQELLSGYLLLTGFVAIRKVKGFGLFDDSSNGSYKDVAISCNLIAEKPLDPQ
jgi:predicted SAM-dependent methyltransferase